jgi:hypothetical protein
MNTKSLTSVTRGHAHRRRRFMWHYDRQLHKICIENENGLPHKYTLIETHAVLASLHRQFGNEFFPLANNVEWMGNGTEKPGLGMAIMEQGLGNATHGQGASYLGVVLEECEYLRWNGERHGIMWKVIRADLSLSLLEAVLQKFAQ